MRDLVFFPNILNNSTALSFSSRFRRSRPVKKRKTDDSDSEEDVLAGSEESGDEERPPTSPEKADDDSESEEEAEGEEKKRPTRTRVCSCLVFGCKGVNADSRLGPSSEAGCTNRTATSQGGAVGRLIFHFHLSSPGRDLSFSLLIYFIVTPYLTTCIRCCIIAIFLFACCLSLSRLLMATL